MEENRKLVRPPFDEEGNVIWTDEEKPTKKKALRWWVWLIPVGLICVIGLGVLLYKSAHRKTPQELCRAALKDAFADGLGYREPMMKALHMQDLADIFAEGPTDIGVSLSLRDTNLSLGDLGAGDSTRKLSDYAGFGFGVNVGIDGENVGVDLRGSISALSLSLLKAFYDGDTIYLTSPKLLKEVLAAKVSEIPGAWENAPLWEMLPAERRDSAKSLAQSGFSLLDKGYTLLQNIRKALAATYPADESVVDRIVAAIRYEQMKDAKGNERTEMVVVGSEKVPCYVFRIQVDEDEFYKIADVIANAVGGAGAAETVHGAWRLRPEGDGNGVEVFAYVTKGGELARLTAEVTGYAWDKPATITADLQCTGSEDLQDRMYLTVTADIDGKKYTFDAKKTVSASRTRVSSKIELSLQLPDKPQYGANASINYNVSGAILDVEANTVYQGDTVGTMRVTAECNYKNGWEMKFDSLSFEDRYNGKNATFSGRIAFAPTQYAPEKPEGEQYNLLTLTPEQANEMIQEGIDQLEWYYNKFLR